MQFITTDQRIAVENFEIGLIYTVTFTSGSYFLGACIGIGKDYVMFQRTAPELIFSLTMAATADVASIEPLGDDIGKILEYTGSVPVSIKTDGSPLLDYLITGDTIQNGTPTPSAPIPVVGVGELDSGQYKIPILSNSTTTPIYLGETHTIRKVKKIVLKGDTTDGIYGITSESIIYITPVERLLNQGAFCTHYESTTKPQGTTMPLNSVTTLGGAGFSLWFRTEYTTIADFKSYLAAQYAAGTPVCVWYVLARATTDIVNEQLMKIGTYADTISYRQSGVNVPTTDGLNIFDIDTTVKPSEVYLKYFSPIF